MIKITLIFLLAWACVALAYSQFRALSGRAKLTFLKLSMLSGAAAAVAAIILTSIVYLF